MKRHDATLDSHRAHRHARYHHRTLFFNHFSRRALHPSSSSGRVCRLKDSTHLCPVHALLFSRGLGQHYRAGSTQSSIPFAHVVTLSTVGIRYYKNEITSLISITPLFSRSEKQTPGHAPASLVEISSLPILSSALTSEFFFTSERRSRTILPDIKRECRIVGKSFDEIKRRVS